VRITLQINLLFAGTALKLFDVTQQIDCIFTLIYPIFLALITRIKYIKDKQIHFNFLDLISLHFGNQQAGFFEYKITMTTQIYVSNSTPF